MSFLEVNPPVSVTFFVLATGSVSVTFCVFVARFRLYVLISIVITGHGMAASCVRFAQNNNIYIKLITFCLETLVKFTLIKVASTACLTALLFTDLPQIIKI